MKPHISITGNGYRFYIWDEGERRRVHASCGFCTEADYSTDMPEIEIVRRYLREHYEPRLMQDLSGAEKMYPPLYDESMTEAVALKERLEEIFQQQELAM